MASTNVIIAFLIILCVKMYVASEEASSSEEDEYPDVIDLIERESTEDEEDADTTESNEDGSTPTPMEQQGVVVEDDDDAGVAVVAAAAAETILSDVDAHVKGQSNPFVRPHVTDKTYTGDFFAKLHPHNLFKPITDKIALISDYLAYPYHPNYGGVTLLNADYIWQKFNQKYHSFVPNTHKAIFGFGPAINHDYPFAYRNLQRLRKKRQISTATNKNEYFFPYFLQKHNWQQVLNNAAFNVPANVSGVVRQ